MNERKFGEGEKWLGCGVDNRVRESLNAAPENVAPLRLASSHRRFLPIADSPKVGARTYGVLYPYHHYLPCTCVSNDSRKWTMKTIAPSEP